MSKITQEIYLNPCSPTSKPSIHRNPENGFKTETFNQAILETTSKKTVQSKPCKCLFAIFHLLLSIIRRLMNKGISNEQMLKNVAQICPQKKGVNVKKAVKFFKLLMLLKRCVKIMKARTKFRGIEVLKKKELEIIGDASNFGKTKERRIFLFFLIRSKVLRKFFISLIKFGNRYLRKPTKFASLMLAALKKQIFWLDAHIPIILPGMKMKLIWDLIIIFVISLYFYLIPMQLFFDFFYDEEIEHAFELAKLNHYLAKFIIMIPEILLVFDSILKFFTGFYEDGVVVTQKSRIVSHYLHKGLIFDILSYLPVILQGVVRSNFPQEFEHHPIIIKEFQLLMFFKIKRVRIAIANFEEIIASKGNRGIALSFFKLIYVILFATHLNACIWHGVAYYYPDTNASTWLDAGNLRGEYWLIRYAYSFFWAISAVASIGQDDILSPQNSAEIITGSCLVLISLLLLCFCINSMKIIFDAISKPENDYKEMIRIINSYMKKNDLGFELQSRVRRYLEYTMKNEDDELGLQKILNKLTKSLKSEVLVESYGKYIIENKFFGRFSNKTKEKLILAINEVKFSPEEIIYQEQELNDGAIYLLWNGMVEETVGSSKGVKSHTLRTISVFPSFFQKLILYKERRDFRLAFILFPRKA